MLPCVPRRVGCLTLPSSLGEGTAHSCNVVMLHVCFLQLMAVSCSTLGHLTDCYSGATETPLVNTLQIKPVHRLLQPALFASEAMFLVAGWPTHIVNAGRR